MITRFISSSSPVIYWFAAFVGEYGEIVKIQRAIANPKSILFTRIPPKLRSIKKTTMSKRGEAAYYTDLIHFYFIGYYIVGTVFFSNYFPFT